MAYSAQVKSLLADMPDLKPALERLVEIYSKSEAYELAGRVHGWLR